MPISKQTSEYLALTTGDNPDKLVTQRDQIRKFRLLMNGVQIALAERRRELMEAIEDEQVKSVRDVLTGQCQQRINALMGSLNTATRCLDDILKALRDLGNSDANLRTAVESENKGEGVAEL